jgi:hypothetical protein
MSGLDKDGIRVAYQLVNPDQTENLEIQSDAPSPLTAIARLLNELGGQGWELVTYDTTTNRGVFKRPRNEQLTKAMTNAPSF